MVGGDQSGLRMNGGWGECKEGPPVLKSGNLALGVIMDHDTCNE